MPRSRNNRMSVEALESRRLLTAATIATGPSPPGNGDVVMAVNEVGSFGSDWGTSDDLLVDYNPNGPKTTANPLDGELAVYESGLALGKTAASTHMFLDELAGSSRFTQRATTRAVSTFNLSECDLQTVSPCTSRTVVRVTLTQELTPEFDALGNRSGSLLSQNYNFQNVSSSAVRIDAIRYFDGHLAYHTLDQYEHSGGRLSSGELFEIDRSSQDVELAFASMLTIDHPQINNNAFGMADWFSLNATLNGAPLNNQVLGDGSDADQLIDPPVGNDLIDIDSTMWMRNNFSIPVGQSIDYETRILFGTDLPGAPSVVDASVEDASNTVTIVFNDEVDVARGDLSLFDANNGVIPIQGFDYDILSSTATWTFNGAFNPNRLKLSANVTDLSQNKLSGGEFEFRFGDVDGIPGVAAADLDLICAAISSNSNDLSFDVNGDGQVSEADLDFLVEDVLQTHRGDADLNGTVDFADFTVLSANFGKQGGWAQGDFNCSGTVDFADFLLLSANIGK